MSIEGMDVELAQAIARELDDSAQALFRIGGVLGALTTELLFHWRGSASMTFEQQWTAQHQPALHAASGALADMHAHLVANIAEQVRASAADGPGLLSEARHFYDVAHWVDETAKGAGDARKWIIRIAGNDLITGRYGKAWTRWLRLTHDAPLLKYKSWPVMHSLHDNEWVQKASRTLDDPTVGRFFDVADKVGEKFVIPLAIVGGLFDAGYIVKDLKHHQYLHAVGYGLDVTATGLMLIPTPPTIAIGVAITVARAVPWDKIWAAADDYLPAAMTMFAGDVPARFSGKLEEIF